MVQQLGRLDDRVWTPADLDRLVEQTPGDVDWRRLEIVDGLLVVSPQATPRHELVVAELTVALRPSLPRGARVIGAAMIDIRPTYRVTDVTVLADRAFRRGVTAVSPADVLLAVEIESPSSLTTDRITKPAQYAAAGIQFFWRVEVEPLRLHAYRLDGGAYVGAGSWGRGETVRVAEPFPVEFAVDDLLPE